MACILLWSSAVRIHDSQAYRKMDVTGERISGILELGEILLSVQTGFSLVNAAVVCAIIMIMIMEISTAPYLLKILQPKARTKAIQTTVTSHACTRARVHTHTHTHSHTRHHLRITCHQNTHAKRLKIKPLELHLHSLSLSLSRSPYSLTHMCRSHAILQEEKLGEQLNTQRSSKRLVRTLSGIVCF